MILHSMLTIGLMIIGCCVDWSMSVPLPEKQQVSKPGCSSKPGNDSDAANLTAIMGDIKKSSIESLNGCHNSSTTNDDDSFAASAIPGLKKKLSKKTTNEHDEINKTTSKKKSNLKTKTSLSKINTDNKNEAEDSKVASITDDTEVEKPKVSLTKINTDTNEIEKSKASVVEDTTDKGIDVKGLASVFHDVEASKRNIPAHIVIQNKTSLHSTIPTLNKALETTKIHTAIKDITPNAASTEEPTIISEDKPLTHAKNPNMIVSPKIIHTNKNDSISGIQRSTHPSIVPSDESIKSTANNSSNSSSTVIKGGIKGKVGTAPSDVKSVASGTGSALQPSTNHAKTPSSKSPPVDPYAEIAEGPDRPTLPELKTNSENDNGPPSKVMKANHPPEPSIEGAATDKPMEVPAPSSKGGKNTGVQDVGGLLDRLTDKLNKGENIANEQPNESNNLQEQLGEYEHSSSSKEHSFDKEIPPYSNPSDASFENMQTNFDKVSESAMSKDSSPFDKEPMFPKERSSPGGSSNMFSKQPGFQKSNNWEDYNSILKGLDEEAKHGPGMNEYSYDEQNQYHPNANGGMTGGDSMPGGNPMAGGNPMGGGNAGNGEMNYPGENEGRSEQSDERSDSEGGARAAAQGEMGPFGSSNSYTAAAVGAMENGASYDRQNVAAMNYLSGSTGPEQGGMSAAAQNPFNGFGAPQGGGYGGAMMKRDYTFYPRFPYG